MKFSMKFLAFLVALSIIVAAPGLGCYQALAESLNFNVQKVPSQVKPVNIVGIAGLPANGSLSGMNGSLGLNNFGVGEGFIDGNALKTDARMDAAALDLSKTLPALGEDKDEGDIVDERSVLALPLGDFGWKSRVNVLHKKVKGIVSLKNWGDKIAGLGRLFDFSDANPLQPAFAFAAVGPGGAAFENQSNSNKSRTLSPYAFSANIDEGSGAPPVPAGSSGNISEADLPGVLTASIREPDDWKIKLLAWLGWRSKNLSHAGTDLTFKIKEDHTLHGGGFTRELSGLLKTKASEIYYSGTGTWEFKEGKLFVEFKVKEGSYWMPGDLTMPAFSVSMTMDLSGVTKDQLEAGVQPPVVVAKGLSGKGDWLIFSGKEANAESGAPTAGSSPSKAAEASTYDWLYDAPLAFAGAVLLLVTMPAVFALLSVPLAIVELGYLGFAVWRLDADFADGIKTIRNNYLAMALGLIATAPLSLSSLIAFPAAGYGFFALTVGVPLLAATLASLLGVNNAAAPAAKDKIPGNAGFTKLGVMLAILVAASAALLLPGSPMIAGAWATAGAISAPGLAAHPIMMAAIGGGTLGTIAGTLAYKIKPAWGAFAGLILGALIGSAAGVILAPGLAAHPIMMAAIGGGTLGTIVGTLGLFRVNPHPDWGVGALLGMTLGALVGSAAGGIIYGVFAVSSPLAASTMYLAVPFAIGATGRRFSSQSGKPKESKPIFNAFADWGEKILSVIGKILSIPMKLAVKSVQFFSKRMEIAPPWAANILSLVGLIVTLDLVLFDAPIFFAIGAFGETMMFAALAHSLFFDDANRKAFKKLSDAVERHRTELMSIPGVTAARAESTPSGGEMNRIYMLIELTKLDADNIGLIPKSIEGYPVETRIVRTTPSQSGVAGSREGVPLSLLVAEDIYGRLYKQVKTKEERVSLLASIDLNIDTAKKELGLSGIPVENLTSKQKELQSRLANLEKQLALEGGAMQ